MRPPGWLVAWGLSAIGGTLVLSALSTAAIVYLYRTGAWTRGQVDLWGPILLFAAITVPNAVSLIVLRRLARTRLARPQGPGSGTGPPGPM